MRGATSMLVLGACGFNGPGTQLAPIDAAVADGAPGSTDGKNGPDATTDAKPSDAAIDAGLLPNFAFLIEAEEYNQINAAPANHWAVAADIAGYRGTGLVACGPQTGGDCTLPYSTCSSLTYDLANAAAGAYFIHLRMYSVAADTDSIYFVLDGGTTLDEVDPARVGWSWVTGGQPYSLPAGNHTLTLYRRECGARVDQIAVTQVMAAPP